jgi:hypothetical protein
MENNQRRDVPESLPDGHLWLNTDDSWAETELVIASAGRYVWPSDDLRPRVLEAAREHAGQRQTLVRLAAMMIAATLCVMTGVSVSNHLQAATESAAMPRGEKLEQLIDSEVMSSGQTQDWVLADLLHRWRNELASRLPEGTAYPRKQGNRQVK